MSKVAWDYIVKVVLPKDLKGVEPGKLSPELLVSIPGGGKLHRLAAQAWLAMVAKAKAEGVELMLATPGKSQHNLGIAVDIHSASEPKRLNWLIANVKDFGWSWEVVPSEPWHIRYVAGDAVPAAVQAWVDANPGAVPAASAAPAPAAAKPAPAAAKPAVAGGKPAFPGPLTAGATGAAVKALQEKLGVPATGTFDAATGAAVKKFKSANGLGTDEAAGPKVWAKLFA